MARRRKKKKTTTTKARRTRTRTRARRTSNPAPRKRRRKARRSRSRSVAVVVANPRRRRRRARRTSNPSRRSLRRRRNPGSGGAFPVKNVLIGGGAAATVMALSAIADYKGWTPTSISADPVKKAAFNIALGLGAGYVVAKYLKQPAAGAGIAAGLVGAGAYQLAAPTIATMIGPPASPPPVAQATVTAPVGAVQLPMGAVEMPYGYQLGAVELPMGAVEFPMGSAYAPYDSYPVNGGFFAQ